MEKITLIDENNRECNFFIYDIFLFNEDKYLILLPCDGDDKLCILKEKNENTYSGIEDSEEYEIIKREYRRFIETKNIYED